MERGDPSFQMTIEDKAALREIGKVSWKSWCERHIRQTRCRKTEATRWRNSVAENPACPAASMAERADRELSSWAWSRRTPCACSATERRWAEDLDEIRDASSRYWSKLGLSLKLKRYGYLRTWPRTIYLGTIFELDVPISGPEAKQGWCYREIMAYALCEEGSQPLWDEVSLLVQTKSKL